MENRPVVINSESEYPNASLSRNSDIPKKPAERPKQEPILEEGRVTVKKQSAWKRARHKILAEDGTRLKDYVVNDVLVPTIKNAISDTVTNGIDILLYGEAKHGRTGVIGGNKNTKYVSYSSINNAVSRPVNRPVQGSAMGVRNSLALDDFIFQTRAEANDVLDRLGTIISDYGLVTVADLYDICNMRCPYTYNNYVWRDLSTAGVTLVRDGYLLNLPTPQTLD